MKFEAISIDSTDNSITLKTPTNEVTSDNLSVILNAMMVDDRTLLAWDLDETISHILKRLPKSYLTQLQQTNSTLYKDYKIFYITSKLFSLSYINTTEYKAYNIYHLTQYFPDNEEPKSLSETQALIDSLINAFNEMGFKPTKLSSAVSVYEKQVLDTITLPTIKSSNITMEAAKYAWLCSGKLWIEAYKIGHWK